MLKILTYYEKFINVDNSYLCKRYYFKLIKEKIRLRE